MAFSGDPTDLRFNRPYRASPTDLPTIPGATKGRVVRSTDGLAGTGLEVDGRVPRDRARGNQTGTNTYARSRWSGAGLPGLGALTPFPFSLREEPVKKVQAGRPDEGGRVTGAGVGAGRAYGAALGWRRIGSDNPKSGSSTGIITRRLESARRRGWQKNRVSIGCTQHIAGRRAGSGRFWSFARCPFRVGVKPVVSTDGANI
eukprot:519483-Pleurochrysis_carterae.AAC.1